QAIRLLAAGHVHLFEALDFGGERPPQLVVGNSGTALDPAITGTHAGRALAGARLRHFTGFSGFGYALVRSAPAGWTIDVRDPAGRALARCHAAYLDHSFGTEIQQAEIADPRVTYLLAEVDGVLAGYVQLRDAPPPDGISVSGPMELARLYVGAEWHGRGVAGALMRACEAHAAGCGARSLWLCVWRRNARAIGFYRKCGF